MHWRIDVVMDPRAPNYAVEIAIGNGFCRLHGDRATSTRTWNKGGSTIRALGSQRLLQLLQRVAHFKAWNGNEAFIVGPDLPGPMLECDSRDLQIEDSLSMNLH